METTDPFFLQLKQLRLAQDITLESISETTKIDLRFLEGLESGDFTLLPRTYQRLFLRSYCGIIGADHADALEQLDSHLEAAAASDASQQGSGPEPPGLEDRSGLLMNDRPPLKLRRDIIAATGIFLILIIIATVVWKINTGREKLPMNTPVPARSAPAGSGPGGAATSANPVLAGVPAARQPGQPALPAGLFTPENARTLRSTNLEIISQVRLTLAPSDDVIVFPTQAGRAGPGYSLAAGQSVKWEIYSLTDYRTMNIHHLKGDINGNIIAFGRAVGPGSLRIWPNGKYEVLTYAAR